MTQEREALRQRVTTIQRARAMHLTLTTILGSDSLNSQDRLIYEQKRGELEALLDHAPPLPPRFVFQAPASPPRLQYESKDIQRDDQRISSPASEQKQSRRSSAKRDGVLNLVPFAEIPVVTMRAGEILHYPGDRADAVVVVRRGQAFVYNYDSYNSRRLISELVKAPDILGLELFGETREYESFAEALTDCLVQYVRAQDLNSLFQREPSLPLLLLRAQNDRMERRDRRMREWGGKRIEQRVAGAIFELADEDGFLPTHIIQTFIADLAGCTRESANKILRRLVKQGILVWDRSRPRVIRPDRLQLLYEEMYDLFHQTK